MDCPPAGPPLALISIGKLRAIVELRGRNGDPRFPYLCVLRATEAIGAAEGWPHLTAALTRGFQPVKPRAVLFFHPNHLPLRAPISQADDHLLAAPARLMAEKPNAEGFGRIHLKRSANLDFYPRYKAIYQAAYQQRPALRGEVRTESEESLALCIREGFLFEIGVDGQWAGIIAAKWRTLAAIRGIFMVEIVLGEEQRGQRLGPAVHQHFACAIMDEYPDAVITGTISDKNPWSLATARRAGRAEIGAWHWVNLT